VPTSYFRWCASECECIDPWLLATVKEELHRRQVQAERQRDEPGRAITNLRGLVDSWYRGLVLKYHPDRGGSHEAMVAINDAKDRLMALVDQR
jgi:hypothetical protein